MGAAVAARSHGQWNRATSRGGRRTRTALEAMRMRTSPARGGATKISTTLSGCFGPKATAARHLMGSMGADILSARRRFFSQCTSDSFFLPSIIC
jgi:hypothetical protein